MKIMTPVPLTFYNGILYYFENEQKAQKENQYINDITEIIINQVKKDFKYCNFSLHYSISDIRTFKWNNWLVEPCYTYIVSLKDEMEIRENFSSSLRRKISRAEEQNLKLTEDDNIESLITLQEESYKKNGLKPILDNSTFIKFCNNARDAGLLKVFSIYGNEGKIYSSRAILLWNNVVYDWIAGTSTDFQHTNSTHLLVWEILKKYSKEGYRSFDFMGANTRKIIDFKKSFGGKLTTYYDVKYYSSSFVKLLFRINEMFLRRKRNL
jgi:lipid II:glycine glycyltransferase (peptidoglycan interpeptide bridge formation enzyme)